MAEYPDGENIDIGDEVQVKTEDPDYFETARVVKISKKGTVYIEYTNILAPLRRCWISPAEIDLIAREN